MGGAGQQQGLLRCCQNHTWAALACDVRCDCPGCRDVARHAEYTRGRAECGLCLASLQTFWGIAPGDPQPRLPRCCRRGARTSVGGADRRRGCVASQNGARLACCACCACIWWSTCQPLPPVSMPPAATASSPGMAWHVAHPCCLVKSPLPRRRALAVGRAGRHGVFVRGVRFSAGTQASQPLQRRAAFRLNRTPCASQSSPSASTNATLSLRRFTRSVVSSSSVAPPPGPEGGR